MSTATLQRPVGPFGGVADYDSGWVWVDPGETRTFSHNLGGDPDEYIVDLSAVPMGLVTQAPFSQAWFGGDSFWDDGHQVEHGYFWHSLDHSQIKVVKGQHDDWMGPLRVRIWRVPDADYDSEWQGISRNKLLVLEHQLGGDPDDYFVYLEFHDTYEAFGVNRAAYGLDSYFAGHDNNLSMENGAAWMALTAREIRVDRAETDFYADRVRVRIWRVPGADYDSGWLEIDQSETLTLEHDLGGPWNDFFVDVQFWRDEWPGRHQTQYGLDTARPFDQGRVYGASLNYLMDGTVSIFRGGHDILVHRVRVRIWADPAPKYDSGWAGIDQDEWLTLEHGLGGDPDFYHVDLRFMDTEDDGDCCHGISHWGLGGDVWTDPDDNKQSIGAYWNQLTSESVVVRRYPGDKKADRVRLRIWQAPPPGYGFAGPGAGTGPGGQYDHNLGGDPADYVVAVQAQHGDWLGRNTLGFGRDRTSADYMQGYHWTDLTDKKVDIVFGGQAEMEYPHVSIWRHPNPDYDSGWRPLTPAVTEVFTHGLDLHPNLQVVDLQFQGEQGGLGVNQAGYGSDKSYAPGEGWSTWGGFWYGMRPERLKVWRCESDSFAEEGRVRIWNIGACSAVEAGIEPPGSGIVQLNPVPNCGSGRGYRQGSSVEHKAIPGPGYAFDRWVTEAGHELTENPQSFFIAGDSVVTARFARNTGSSWSYLPLVLR